MNRQRTRTRNGIPTHIEQFYCSYGKHYVIPLNFELETGNKGICLDCAFAVYDIFKRNLFIPEMSARERVKARASWEQANTSHAVEERLRRGSKDPGWVYYIAQGDLIKIGYATDVTERMKVYGPTATLLAVHPGTRELEREMHVKFRAALSRGREWFDRSDDLMAHIAEVFSRFGDPAPLAYQYTQPRSQEDKVRGMFATREHVGIANGVHSAR